MLQGAIISLFQSQPKANLRAVAHTHAHLMHFLMQGLMEKTLTAKSFSLNFKLWDSSHMPLALYRDINTDNTGEPTRFYL